MQPFDYTLKVPLYADYHRNAELKRQELESLKAQTELSKQNAETNRMNAATNAARQEWEKSSDQEKKLTSMFTRELHSTLKSKRPDLAKQAIQRYVRTMGEINPSLLEGYETFEKIIDQDPEFSLKTVESIADAYGIDLGSKDSSLQDQKTLAEIEKIKAQTENLRRETSNGPEMSALDKARLEKLNIDNASKIKEAVDSATSQLRVTDVGLSAVDRIMSKVAKGLENDKGLIAPTSSAKKVLGFFRSQPMITWLSSVFDQDAANLVTEIEGLKKMSAMFNVGALKGVLSDSDMKVLQELIGNIERARDPQLFYDDMKAIRGRIESIKKDLSEFLETGFKKYETSYESSPQYTEDDFELVED